ncbi:MAG: phosphonate C-P lyase system protein PhnG [Desulfuromonadales bacterium]
MNRSDKTTIVAFMDDRAVDDLLELLAGQEIEVVMQPRTGLVMMPLTDSFLTDFNLGEVLVTEAGVSVDGIKGYGMVTGDDPRRALARAAAAAILTGGESPLRARLVALLEKHESLRLQAHTRERLLTESTRVNFDLMAGA